MIIEPELAAAIAAHHPEASIEATRDEWGNLRLVVRDDQGKETRYVAEVVPPDAMEWRRRELRVVQSGLLRALPAGIEAGLRDVITTAAGDQLALLLDIPRASDDALDVDMVRAVLVALARMHSAFAGFPARLTSGLKLLPMGQWLTMSNPASDVSLSMKDGWSAFARDMPSAWDIIARFFDNPAPLVDALRDCQPTIIQGLPTPAMVSFRVNAVVFHDWWLLVRGPGALDLGAFVVAGWPTRDLGVAGCVEIYRAERARLGRLPADGERWERELALGLLAGVLRGGYDLWEGPQWYTTWEDIVIAGEAAIG
ncbi:MAG TPA: hypothetical protein PL172_01640 [Thermomicrobiales bacterium]|nr:hypothetical protein [Thermomicrobiales bacterium]